MEISHLNLLEGRLLFDYRVAMAMHNPYVHIAAYRDVDDALARRDPILSEAEGHLATHYIVDYHINTMIDRGSYSSKTTVHFDLLANMDYPHSEPSCFVINSHIPWSPHFLKDAPICIGEFFWKPQGNTLLGHLIVHIAKLLNFDEPAHDPGYVGWNEEAIRYWQTQLNGQPITPNLAYPKLPGFIYEKAKEVARKPPVMKIIGTSTVLPSPAALPHGLFRITEEEPSRPPASKFRITGE